MAATTGRYRPLSALAAPRQPSAVASTSRAPAPAPATSASTARDARSTAAPAAEPTTAAPAPKKQGKLTAAHGEPPTVIVRDKGGSLQRGEMLGEGGFARVYRATEDDGSLKAVKIIAKDQLKTSKNRAKLFSEIKSVFAPVEPLLIAQAMVHGNIVRFESCFEDTANVYMVLTLCANGSLLDLLRIRKRYTEAETRFYLVQLIGACDYMHSRSVIHRDLKLGNLLLDADMNLHVADFGLAALVRFPGERKKTVCGTPNYIAPEILFDQDNGHSFEVDIWSIGVILYTLLVGKPPFQTKDVKTIYKKIRDNHYSYPEGAVVSESARHLISIILTTDPTQRPTLVDILEHPFFHEGPFPRTVPASARDTVPDFAQLPASTWASNFARTRRHAMSGADAALPAAATTEMPPSGATAKLEQDVQRALDPGSPIAELLRSARKPLQVSPATNEAKDALRRGQDRRVGELQQANADERQMGRRRSVSFAATDPDAKENVHAGARGPGDVSPVDKTKARLVQQMMASRSPRTSASTAPRAAAASPSRPLREESVPPASSAASSSRPTHMSSSRVLYETCAHALAQALAVRTAREADDLPAPPPGDQPPLVFVTSWIDYTHKYGTAYQLTDGSSGVYFNDSTTMILSPDREHFDYIARRSQAAVARSHHTLTDYASELDRKVYLLRYFHDYMTKQLERTVDWTFRDTARTVGMDFLVKYYRLNTAIVFRLSNDVLQFNFFDHCKVLLTSGATVVTFIGPDYVLKSYALATLTREAIRLGVLPDGLAADRFDPASDPTGKQARRRERIRTLLEKLTACHDLLRGLIASRSAPI